MHETDIRAELRTIHALTMEARDTIDRTDADPQHLKVEAEETAARIAHAAAGIAGGEYRPECNGWVNRETWNTVLWMQNDQGSAEAALDVLRDAINGADWDSRGTREHDIERRYLIGTAGRALREWWDETFAPTDEGEGHGPLSDVWSYAMASVHWDDVAEAIAEGHDIDHLPPAR